MLVAVRVVRGRVAAVVLLALAAAAVVVDGLKCDRTPEGVITEKRRAQDRFIIEVSGNPSTYVPGEQYTIFLRTNPEFQTQHKFKDFLLSVEQEPSEKVLHEMYAPSVGSLQLYGDMMTKFSEKCRNAVMQTNSLPKSEVQILWLAPPAGSGCVVIRATVVESKDVWYADEGKLSKVLCEELEENEDSQPNVLRHCCACDEAKYEVTFEGLWSRNTHPKDFPSNGWLTRFSDIIGASHSVDYTFWSYGDVASEGLRQLAENGNTRMLEGELKEKSNRIRTIIKARGISYPNITGKTFAVFRVDSKHHLMSLVSMIDPSPDWIVGVSSLELCLRNCSWVESRVLNLYPWDAGTDDGPTYISPNQPSNPRDPIRRIKSNSPNDPRSPFYDPDGVEMKPLARLYLSRQRLYEKTCVASQMDNNEEFDAAGGGADGGGTAGHSCAVEPWSVWSPCSATCGKGVKYKQRAYKNEEDKYYCSKVLTKRGFCTALQVHCRNPAQGAHEHNPHCALTDWGEWSSCTVSCGKGIKTRSRRYKNRNAAKRCAAGNEHPEPLEQNIECDEGECPDGDPEPPSAECEAKPWSTWSPCSSACGKGIKTRTRVSFPQSASYSRYHRSRDDDDDEEDDEDCPMEEKVECVNDENPVCNENEDVDPVSCTMPRDEGGCKSNVDRWYFDMLKATCDIFSYSGCMGNKNNFKTLERCENICGNYKRELNANRTALIRQHGVSVSGVLTYNMQLQNDDANREKCDNEQSITGIPSSSHKMEDQEDNVIEQRPYGNVIDCKMSPWSPWSPCKASCGKQGFKTRYRTIKVHPMNGGEKCPEKLIKKHRCQGECGDSSNTGNDDRGRDPNEDSELNPTWGQPGPVENIRVDCEMSNWSAWSPCSRSCGSNAVQQRTRSIKQQRRGRGRPCLHRTEERACSLLACPE